MNIANWIDHWASSTPEKTALSYADKKISYAEFDKQVKLYAMILQTHICTLKLALDAPRIGRSYSGCGPQIIAHRFGYGRCRHTSETSKLRDIPFAIGNN